MAVLYVGSYTQDAAGAATGSSGIYVFELDEETGKAQLLQTLGDTVNPSFLAVQGENLYACSETMGEAGVTSYRRLTDGRLKQKGYLKARGKAACHVSVEPEGKHLFLSNYLGGNLLSVALNDDGTPRCVEDDVQHTGQGTDAFRQEAAHIHAAFPVPETEMIAAADLGLDKVFFYKVLQNGKLVCQKEVLETPGGEGPRHMVFSGDGRHLYLVTEMGNHVFHFQRTESGWENVQRLAILPKEVKTGPEVLAADIHLSPDGRFLYASARGWNGLAAYRVEQDGALTFAGHYFCGGDGPRNFCISPDGRWVAVANQYSGTVAFLLRDVKSGALKEAVYKLCVPQAVCVLWVSENQAGASKPQENMEVES